MGCLPQQDSQKGSVQSWVLMVRSLEAEVEAVGAFQ